MPRFPVAFNRRKSNADTLENAVAGSSFRVLDRSEVVSSHGHSHSISNSNNTPNGNGNSASRFSVKSQSMPNTLAVDNEDDTNLFANLNTNRYDIPEEAEPRNSEHKTNKWYKRRTDTNLVNGSGSANTTNTNSTDNSSRHSNVSTAPSSADLNAQQQQQQYQQQHQPQQQDNDWKAQSKKQQYGDIPLPPIPKSSTTSSFLKSAGRTLSFGGNKKHLPILPDDGKPPQTPPTDASSGRDRSMTASTVTTATPPKIEEEFDLGGDFSKMLGNFDNKRASVATLRMGQQINGDKNGNTNTNTDRPALVPRSLTGNRLNQPAPIQVDHAAKIEPSPYSWGSQNSNDKLLYSHNLAAAANENAPPAVPRHASPLALGEPATSPNSNSNDSGLKRSSAVFGRRRSTLEYAAEAEDEDTVLLKDSLFSVNRFLAGSVLSNAKPANTSPSSRFGRRHDDALDSSYSKVPTESTSPKFGAKAVADDEDNLFDSSVIHSNKMAPKFVPRKASPPRNKVMTPAQFERYRKDKEREDVSKTVGAGDAYNKKTGGNNSGSDDDDNYEDDVDEAEKSRQAAKQRRKQEAHMAVYRQQMMKVTGEASPAGPAGPVARSSIYFSMSTPNLPSLSGTSPHNGSEAGGNEDDDEEVPLAILAAHGFPNRNRPPTRLSTMMSNPNLRAAAAPSFQRPQSVMGGDAQQHQQQPQQPAAGNGGRLPVFARNLPQDPYGLVNSNQRETLNFAGGAPAGGLPPGGLVGVIASEERSRAMRRGSPALDSIQKPLPNMSGNSPHYDPMGGIPAQMMYPGVGAGMGGQMPMMSPADQAQIQMTQQMQQFMQMQMQFMQMMANGGNGQRPVSQYGSVQGAPMGMGNMGMGMNGMGGMGGIGGMGGMGADGSVRNSFADHAPMLDLQLPRPDMHSRTMSMVQPSSASWIQPPQHNMGGGYAPSIRVQGAGNGYTPSIAPSERSNVGMPGRYRPVSHMPPAVGGTSPLLDPSPGPTSGASSPGWDISRKHKSPSPLQKEAVSTVAAVDDDDDEEGWAAMKAKRDKKRSMWKSKKTLSSELGALIS